MRGPELHTLLVSRPDPLGSTAGRTLLAGGTSDDGATPSGDPADAHHRAPGAGEARDGLASRRQFASGGYQVHNGRPAAPVVIG